MDLEQAVKWYADMAASPAWKEHAWHMAKEFAREHPAEFRDLPALLTAEMKRRAADVRPSQPQQGRSR
jgi:hypothetical protein